MPGPRATCTTNCASRMERTCPFSSPSNTEATSAALTPLQAPGGGAARLGEQPNLKPRTTRTART
eukprot:6720045-Pyramimonas_sp.AAC.1